MACSRFGYETAEIYLYIYIYVHYVRASPLSSDKFIVRCNSRFSRWVWILNRFLSSIARHESMEMKTTRSPVGSARHLSLYSAYITKENLLEDLFPHSSTWITRLVYTMHVGLAMCAFPSSVAYSILRNCQSLCKNKNYPFRPFNVHN